MDTREGEGCLHCTAYPFEAPIFQLGDVGAQVRSRSGVDFVIRYGIAGTTDVAL